MSQQPLIEAKETLLNKVPFSKNSEAEVVTWCVITLTAKTQLTDLAAVNLTAIGQRVKT